MAESMEQLKHLSLIPAIAYDPDFEPQILVSSPQLSEFASLYYTAKYGYKIIEYNGRKAVAVFGSFSTRKGSLGVYRSLYQISFPNDYIVLISGGIYTDICLNGVVNIDNEAISRLIVSNTIENAVCDQTVRRNSHSNTFTSVVVAKTVRIAAGPECPDYANWLHFSFIVMPLADAGGSWVS